MFARVSILEGPGEGVDQATTIARERLVPALREVDGFAGMLILADRSTGRSMGITLWESEQALRASEDAATGMRSQTADETSAQIVGVERYEVTLDERRDPR